MSSETSSEKTILHLSGREAIVPAALLMEAMAALYEKKEMVRNGTWPSRENPITDIQEDTDEDTTPQGGGVTDYDEIMKHMPQYEDVGIERSDYTPENE